MAKEKIRYVLSNFPSNGLHYTSFVLEGDTDGWDIDYIEARGDSRLTSLRMLQVEIESQYKSRSALVSAEIEKELLMLETQGTEREETP